MESKKYPFFPSVERLGSYRLFLELGLKLMERNEPLAPTMEAMLRRTIRYEKMLAEFGCTGPRIVSPAPYKPVTWVDVMKEDLTKDQFQPKGNGIHHCDLEGVTIEVTTSQRDKVLARSWEPALFRVDSAIQREERARAAFIDFTESIMATAVYEICGKILPKCQYNCKDVAEDFEYDGYSDAEEHDDDDDEAKKITRQTGHSTSANTPSDGNMPLHHVAFTTRRSVYSLTSTSSRSSSSSSILSTPSVVEPVVMGEPGSKYTAFELEDAVSYVATLARNGKTEKEIEFHYAERFQVKRSLRSIVQKFNLYSRPSIRETVKKNEERKRVAKLERYRQYEEEVQRRRRSKE